MKFKKSLLIKNRVEITDNYITDRFIIINRTFPHYIDISHITESGSLSTGDITEKRIKEVVIKPLKDLFMINFTRHNAKYDYRTKTVNIDLIINSLNKNITLELKYYQFIMELMDDNPGLTLYKELNIKHGAIYLYLDNDLVIAVMPFKTS